MIALLTLAALSTSVFQEPDPWPAKDNRLGGGWFLNGTVHGNEDRRALGRVLARAASPKGDPELIAGASESYSHTIVGVETQYPESGIGWPVYVDVIYPGGQGDVTVFRLDDGESNFKKLGGADEYLGAVVGMLERAGDPAFNFYLARGSNFHPLIGNAQGFPLPIGYTVENSWLEVRKPDGALAWKRTFPMPAVILDRWWQISAYYMNYPFDGGGVEGHGVFRYWTGRAGWVANVGRVDGDNTDDIAVTFPGYPNENPTINSSWVRVYSGANGNPLTEFRFDEPRRANRVFGVGDRDGDGKAEVALTGAWSYASFTSANEPVRIFSVAQEEVIAEIPSPEADNARFGFEVDASTDLNGDDVTDILVSAPYAEAGDGFGRVHSYDGSSYETLWTAEGDADSWYFGCSLAFVDDLDRDGVADLAVGDRSGGPQNEGNVWVLSGATGSVLTRLSGATSYDEFGNTLVYLRDHDFDFRRNLAVGASRADSPDGWGGAVYDLEFDPYLRSNTSSLSASSGAMTLSIDFPPSENDGKYYVLLSASGMTPSQLPNGLWVPLSDDALLQSFLDNSPPAWADDVISARVGPLDAEGKATVTLNANPALTAFVDNDLFVSVISIGPAPQNAPRISTTSRRINVVP